MMWIIMWILDICLVSASFARGPNLATVWLVRALLMQEGSVIVEGDLCYLSYRLCLYEIMNSMSIRLIPILDPSSIFYPSYPGLSN